MGLPAEVVRAGVRYAFTGLESAATPDISVGNVRATPVVDEILPGGIPRTLDEPREKSQAAAGRRTKPTRATHRRLRAPPRR